MAGGRPEKFTQELADLVCEKISTSSVGLKRLCKEDGMPGMTTIFKWLKENEEFAKQYARAREAQADFLCDEILDIVDDGSNDLMTVVKGKERYEIENKEVVNRSRLRMDARKWIASKLYPKKYSDKTDIVSNGETLTKIDVTFPK